VKSVTTAQFWKLYRALPKHAQDRADRAYQLWRVNPYASGLYFKRVGLRRPAYSVRIGKSYRTLGMLEGDAMIWFWIGTHDEYERLLKHL
jgi:hypothetical protein